MKQIKYAIAYVIYNYDRSKVFIVQRPFDDDLPDAASKGSLCSQIFLSSIWKKW